MEPATAELRILPHYTGDRDLSQALAHSHGRELLWLEILLNGDFPWQAHLTDPAVRAAYDKACLWYSHFATMIGGRIKRPPLEPRTGVLDMREHRRFLEALEFAAHRS